MGMNPGPWGMAQTGVPFGEIEAVRNWIGLPETIPIGKPRKEHPKRPVLGLEGTRSEVSGRRLWKEWAESTYKSPQKFFETFFIYNYCPLMFLETSGRNRTPVQLRAQERDTLLPICDNALLEVTKAIQPALVCGIGTFAAKRCELALASVPNIRVGCLLHPSPASPVANSGWMKIFSKQLKELLDEQNKEP